MSDEIGERSEYEVLVLASRTGLGEPEAAQLQALLREETIRWRYLMRLAGYHGVQPLLYYHLRKIEAGSDETLARLRSVVGARSAHSLVLTHELDRLVNLFEQEAIPLLAIKGPVLAHTVYGGAALRPFADLDLVIRRDDFNRVDELLHDEGYGSASLHPFQKASYLFIHGQYSFWRRVASMGSAAVFLDVHTAIMPPGYSYSEDFDDLFARSITLSMAGTAVHALEREDLLLVLCFHGFKNRWDRLKYFCDVAELLHTYPDLDWDTVYSRARAMHSERVLRLGLLLVHRLLGAPLPNAVAQDVRDDHRVQTLSTELLERLPRQAYMQVEPYWDRVRLNILAQDGLRGGLRYGAYAAARRLSELYLPSED